MERLPLVAPQRLGARPPPAKSGGLPRWAFATVEALADTAMPPAERVQRRAGPVAAEKLDAILAALPWALRLGLLAGLALIEWSALWLAGKRFTRLHGPGRRSVLDRWHHGPAQGRLILRGLLTPIKAAFYSEPDVAAQLGYLPKPFEPRIGALDELPPGDIRVGSERSAEELSCEVVVVGSGAGGAVVAKELAEKGRRVVLVEEGQYWTRSQFNRRPFDMQQLLYRDLGFTVALGRPGIPIPLGKTVGGTTTVNSGTCFRVPQHTLDRWHREEGLTAFTAEALAPYYQRVEEILHVRPVADAVMGNNARLAKRGAEALGLHLQPLDRNAAGCKGSGVCCFGCPEDAKRSTNVSYVPAALAYGATLFTETLAREIVWERGRAAGLLCEMGPSRTPLRIKAEAVVVAAGAIYTPFFLAPHGLGRRSGQLGRNLSIHPCTKAGALFDSPVLSHDGVPQGSFIHDLAGEGILFEGIATTPDFAAAGLPFFGRRLVEIMDQYANLATFGLMVEDAGRGRVMRGLDGRPLMLYRLGEPEIARLRKGIEILCRILFRAGASVVFPPLSGLPELHEESEVQQIQRMPLVPEDIELTAFHPLGTCRLATDARRGVLDPDLESYERDRLFVADGSIFPSSLGVNPQLTIMAFATRAAERIDQRLAGDGRRYRP